jgi:hypothetical protein
MSRTITEYMVPVLLALAWGIAYCGNHANTQPDPGWEEQRPGLMRPEKGEDGMVLSTRCPRCGARTQYGMCIT